MCVCVCVHLSTCVYMHMEAREEYQHVFFNTVSKLKLKGVLLELFSSIRLPGSKLQESQVSAPPAVGWQTLFYLKNAFILRRLRGIDLAPCAWQHFRNTAISSASPFQFLTLLTALPSFSFPSSFLFLCLVQNKGSNGEKLDSNLKGDEGK